MDGCQIRVAAVAATVFLTPWRLHGQASPVFEVATVKQSPPPPGDTININLGGVRNGTLTLENASLSDCLRFAYGLVSDAQIGGPDWIKSKAVRFDIVARAPPDTPLDQFPAMLQSLLAERLRLAVQYAKKELPYLALLVGRNGSKLRPAKAGAAPPTNPQFAGRIISDDMSLARLVTLLSRFQRQTVVDATGVQGRFEVDLRWSPDTNRTSPTLDDDLNSSRPSLLTAVQEQLGLRLESRKALWTCSLSTTRNRFRRRIERTCGHARAILLKQRAV